MQTQSKILLFLFIAFNLAAFAFAKLTYAASTDSVTATVTVQNISVSVTDGAIAYGTLAINTSAGTNAADTQTATNDGNVTENLNIKGQNSANWTLDSTNATEDHYIHRFCTSSCTSPPTSYTALTTNYQTLATSVSSSGNQTFDLYITTPQSSTVYTQQSVDIMVQAVAS